MVNAVRISNPKDINNVGFEALGAVVMNSCIFWENTPYNPFKVKRRFGRTSRLLLHDRRIRGARNQRESG
jgi:hypothetical protein